MVGGLCARESTEPGLQGHQSERGSIYQSGRLVVVLASH